MRKIFIYLIFTYLSVLNAIAQDRTVSGTVTSAEDGLPLPGVSVIVQGTSKGVATGVDGTFLIKLTEGENTLVFSFVGFETQVVPVDQRSVINVFLKPDTKMLEEVVVVGYGIQKKSDVTGAMASVEGSELVKQPVLTATQAIQGKVAGVQIISSGQPGTSPQVRIRGVSTALSGTTVLFVVDGVLTDDISNINTADIADISILKDASAAAIYGSRGANGVVIITTKNGKRGPLKVNYNSNIGIRQAANLVEMANSAEYSNYVQAATGDAPPASNYSTDWYDVILRNAWQQSHNISLSGGTENATHFLNIGYTDEEGIVVNNDFKRLAIRFNEEYKISDWINLGLQSSYSNIVNENGFGNIDIDAYGNIGSAYNNAYRAAPIIPSIVDGRYGNTSSYQNVGNPLLDVSNNKIKVKENRLQGAGYLVVKPLPWLSFKTSLGADWKNSLNRGYFYQFNADESTFINAGGNQYRSQSSLEVKQWQTFRWVWDNTVTFSKQFNKHNITWLAGTTAEKFEQHWFSAKRNEVPADPNLWYIVVGDANTSQNDGKGDSWARNAYLTRLNYSFDDKYLLTATIRADGSSRLPASNRWKSFPSFGVGWVLSRENFLHLQNLFDFLKLRLSYGRVGNDLINTDAIYHTVVLNKAYAFNGSASIGTNGAQINQIIDPAISWEVTEEYDVATEFALFQSKLTGEINYYNKRVENALIEVPIPRTVGDENGVIVTNAATIENKGVEVLLNWREQVNQNFSYRVGGNVTFNKNQVVALNGGQAIWGGSIGAAQGFTTYTDNGHPVGSFYVLKVIGVFNTEEEVQSYTSSSGKVIQPTAKPGHFKYYDKNDDGVIDDNDRVFAGAYQPVAYFGFNAGVNFKNWDFSFDIYGNTGNKVYNGKKAVRVLGTDNVEKDVVYKRWTPANRSQSEPGANVGNLPASTYYVESGSFARINNITIGYTFPVESLSSLKISGLRVFVTAQNLFTYKKYSGFTAELPGTPLNSGIELSAYPTTRTIAAGLNVDF